MKYFLLWPLLFFSCVASAQNKITVAVNNFSNDKGVCRACLFNNAESFKGDGNPVQCIEAKVSNKAARFEFINVPAGTYAISLFHDANNNNKFDTNFFGIPKEGYGASKNDLPFASAPTFNGNKFEVKNTAVNLQVKLRYL